jgi:hypothetical protein
MCVCVFVRARACVCERECVRTIAVRHLKISENLKDLKSMRPHDLMLMRPHDLMLM